MDCPLLTSFKKLWENTRYVFINQDRLRTVADKWANDEFELPSWRLPILPKNDDDDFIQFIGICSAINFCYTDPKTKHRFKDGAMGLSACLLKNGYHLRGADFLRELEQSDLVLVFGGRNKIPLFEERWRMLREIGHVLETCFHGKFSNILKLANYHAFSTAENTGVVDLLTRFFTAFMDCSFHPSTGSWLPFQKRAQLFVLIYHGRAADSTTLKPIKDIDRLGPIADYRVPQTLRHLGILRYDDILGSKIDYGLEIPKDSEEEIEIRAQTVLAVSRLLNMINKRRQKEPINMCHLDYRLWQAGRKANSRHHLTLTTAY